MLSEISAIYEVARGQWRRVDAYHVDGGRWETALASPPTVLRGVAIEDGPSRAGSVLRAAPGDYTAEPDAEVSYAWARNGVAVLGEVGPSLTTTGADAGALYTLTETAANEHGAASTAASIALLHEIETITPPSLADVEVGQPLSAALTPGEYRATNGLLVIEAAEYSVAGGAYGPDRVATLADLTGDLRAQITLTAQGAASQTQQITGGSVREPTQTPNPATITVVSRSPTGAAPETVMFEVTPELELEQPPQGSAWDPADHLVDYLVEVSGRDDAPLPLADDCVLDNSRNRYFARRPAIYFDEPGTYTITAHAWDRATGTYAVGTYTHEVAAPAAAGLREVTVGASGRSYTSVKTAIDSVRQPTVIYVDAGHVEALPSGIDVRNRHHIKVVGRRDGARPRLSVPGRPAQVAGILLRESAGDYEFTIDGIEMVGVYDAAANTVDGVVIDDASVVPAIRVDPDHAGSYLSISRCKIDRFQIGLLQQDGAAPNTFLADTEITGWQEYCAYLQPCELGVVGCRFVQPQDATSAIGRTSGINKEHGLRCAGNRRATFDRSLLRAHQGWFLSDAASGFATGQAALRILQSYTDGAAHILIVGCVISGGSQVIDATPTNSGARISQSNIRIQMSVLEGDFWSLNLVTAPTGGVTFADNLCIYPHTARVAVTDFRPSAYLGLTDHVDGYNDNGDPLVRGNPVIVANNTVVCHEPGYNPPVVGQVRATFGDVREANNLRIGPGDLATVTQTELIPVHNTLGYHAPNATDGLTPTTEPQTQFATPAGSIIEGKPVAGSAAIGGGISGAPRFDIAGQERNQNVIDLGCWRVSG